MSTSTASSSSSSSSRNCALLSLPGHCTGDIWHNAAAQVLSVFYPQQHACSFSILMAIQSQGQKAEDNIKRQAVNFDYYQAIGLPCLLVKVDVGAADLQSLISGIERMPLAKYEELSCQQKTCSSDKFAMLWPKLPLVDMSKGGAIEGNQAPSSFLPPLHYYAATTVLCSYFSLQLPFAERALRIQRLSRGLRGTLDPISPLEIEVRHQIEVLKSRIAIQRTIEGLPTARVLLFNFRRGFMNPNQDANEGIFQHVKSLGREHGLVVIRVAMGLPATEILPSDFDLFDVSFSDTEILDKRYTSAFWAEVARLPDVFGFIGSRTGSLDIAAFNGVNCFEWDEPVFNVLTGTSSEAEKTFFNKEHLDFQVPQYLRMLQQCSIMSIGLLDLESYVDESGEYTKLEESGLRNWLKGERDVVPSIPRSSSARDCLINVCHTYLEKQDQGIYATNLRILWNREALDQGDCEHDADHWAPV